MISQTSHQISVCDRVRQLMLTCLVTLFTLLTMQISSLAQAVLVDDAHTSTAPKTTDSNFGINPNLFVNAAGNVYIKFKLSSTLPAGTAGSTVERATLKLYLANVTTPGKLDIYTVLGPWDEASITGRSAPLLGSLLTTTTQIDGDKRYEFVVIDITSAVQQWLGDDGQGSNGIPNYGIAIVAHPPDATTAEAANITFDSKENSQTSHEAQLNVQLSTSTTGSSGVTEVTGNGPITVTNSTTTPNISLGLVPANKGGTGLNSPGAPGNLLRSDGSGWTTAPLSAADIPDLAGSYIRNATSLQSSSNFNIGGTGNANILNATTQFNIGGKRVLSLSGNQNFPTSSTSVGVNAGSANTGFANSFFGENAGSHNSTARDNSFFGWSAGVLNSTGNENSFFGSHAGVNNSDGRFNSFFGSGSGIENTSGTLNSYFGAGTGGSSITSSQNSFFGANSGHTNLGNFNSFFGQDAGAQNGHGSNNSFFGWSTANSNVDGNNLTIIGAKANVGADNLNYATAIGADAVVSTSNTVVLGRSVDTVQVPGSLNVSGAFGANILNASTQFNLDGNRILSNTGTNNLFAGTNAGASNTSGNANAFVGKNAGQGNTSGASNSFVGNNAGSGNTTGARNSFFGDAAGFVNANSSDNSFFGFLSGFHNAASGNSFFGSLAGADNTTGFGNAFFGMRAGVTNTNGNSNSFFGSFAGQANGGGSFNSFFGADTGFSNTGNDNAFFGYIAGKNNTTGSSNAFFGDRAGTLNTTGSSNSFFGVAAGTLNKVGSNNTLVGAGTNVADNLTFATAIGAGAFVGTNNTLVLGRNNDTVQIPGTVNAIGPFSASTLDVATQYNIRGVRVLSVTGNGQADSNTFVGVGAGEHNAPNNIDGMSNSFFGMFAGQFNSSGRENALFGTFAGQNNTTGNSNSFFGVAAGGNNSTGQNNSFFGAFTGQNNSTGGWNTFVGSTAGLGNTTGLLNTYIGQFAGSFSHIGSSNTFIGQNANPAPSGPDGDNNTLVGSSTLVDASVSNSSAIGYRAQVTQNNSLVLGGISGINFGTDTNVGIGTTAPKTKLHLKSGKIYIEANGQGVVMKSPAGLCFELTVTDAGTLATSAVACP